MRSCPFLGQQQLTGCVATPEALVRRGVLAGALGSGEDRSRFVLQAPQRFDQVVRRHRQLEALAPLVLAPADVLQQFEVFVELEAKLGSLGEVLVALQRVEEVAHGAEVVAGQLGSIGDVWLTLEENEDMPTSGNGLEGYVCHSVRIRLANYLRICGDIDYYENLLAFRVPAFRVPDYGPKVQMPMGPVEC